MLPQKSKAKRLPNLLKERKHSVGLLGCWCLKLVVGFYCNREDVHLVTVNFDIVLVCQKIIEYSIFLIIFSFWAVRLQVFRKDLFSPRQSKLKYLHWIGLKWNGFELVMWYNNRTCELFWFFMVPQGTICGRDNSYTQDFHKFSYFGEVFWGLSISFLDA